MTATTRPDADRAALIALAPDHPDHTAIEPLDVDDREAIAPFVAAPCDRGVEVAVERHRGLGAIPFRDDRDESWPR